MLMLISLPFERDSPEDTDIVQVSPLDVFTDAPLAKRMIDGLVEASEVPGAESAPATTPDSRVTPTIGTWAKRRASDRADLNPAMSISPSQNSKCPTPHAAVVNWA